MHFIQVTVVFQLKFKYMYSVTAFLFCFVKKWLKYFVLRIKCCVKHILMSNAINNSMNNLAIHDMESSLDDLCRMIKSVLEVNGNDVTI